LPELLEASGPFDIIHAQSAYWGGAVADALANAMGIPFIIQEHRSNYLSGTLGRRTHKELEGIFARASFVTAVSDRMISLLRDDYGVPPDKSDVLPNMVNSGFFGTAGRKRAASFRFAIVAGLTPIKRHDLVLRAFSHVSRARNDVELHVVGDGPTRPALERLARELGIGDRMYWHGWLPPAELPSLYESFDALVLASDHETFGVVLAEAWASGIPVIATRCGGPDSLVKPLNGILVDRGSSAALAEAMDDLLLRRAEFDSETIRENARTEYGEHAVIAKTVRIYEEAIRRFSS
jgi:glycosyltransferase involved in cell wall biosynthesis